ncbi:glycosyltransferase [Aestuariibacter salexigens]|uniref:glycosyltransferase n=1 Tax=Aestuariibacter salexigens TaxID=226010 RepID=UPI00047B99B7|nr:glycosyltransferase [Aestuariibacter salexigens]
MNEHSKNTAGIFSKMLGQASAFAELGHSVRAIYMSLNRIVLSEVSAQANLNPIESFGPVEKQGESEAFWRLAQKLASVKLWSPQLLFCRYDFMFEGDAFLNFLGAQRHRVTLSVVEFPTFPYEKEIRDLRLRAIDQSHAKQIGKYTDYVCSWNPAEEIYNVPNIRFDNKIRIVDKNISQSKAPLIAEDGVIRMLSVANIMFWHGFDRLLKGIANYIQKSRAVPIELTIVGAGEGLVELQTLTQALGLQNIVSFEGFKPESDLKPYFDAASVCIGSLGLHRIGISENSTLKIRNYIANGLPVVMSSKDRDLSEFDWIHFEGPDDTDIDVAAVVEFVQQANQHPHIRRDIRRFARQHLTWINFARAICQLSTPAKLSDQ